MDSYLKTEDDNYLLLESGFKIVLQAGSSSSASTSPSASSSLSGSPSASLSPSASVSLSTSPSASLSPSSSISSSVSASPSMGYTLYSRMQRSSLPTNDAELSTPYTEDEENIVAKEDDVFVNQPGILYYMIHQFKNFVGGEAMALLEWTGKSTLDPYLSPVVLQIYNQSTGLWETLDQNDDGFADVNFVLTKTVRNLTDYKDSSSIITCRVYQLAI